MADPQRHIKHFLLLEKMDQKKQERFKCLLSWIASLPIFSDNGITPNSNHFKDGVMTARILKNAIDPEYFGDLNDSPTESTELVKVVEKMKKYLIKQTGHPAASYMVPNIGKIIAVGDIQEINRLLQFILSCAVNSQRKQSFVTKIMQMEEAVQFDLMNAIKEILEKEEKLDMDLESDIPSRSEVATLNDIIERLSQENHDYKSKLSEMTEEKMTLQQENERLNVQLTAHLNDPESIHVSLRYQEEYKRECDRLREENYRLEAVADDSKIRIQVIEKQLNEVQQKLIVNQTFHEEAVRHKDEVDTLREAASKVPQLENAIQLYKRKLETIDVLKQHLRELEEQNAELTKTNISLEDDMNKAGTWKAQMEDLKKKLIETQQSLSQETQKSRRLDFEQRATREKLGSVQALADRLQEERNTLHSQVEEFRLQGTGAEHSGLNANSVNSIDLVPASARQRITRLELENAELRKKVNSGVVITSDEGSRVIVEELRKREAELDEDLLKKTQDLVDLRTIFEDKVRNLEGVVEAKDEELKKKENQYKKCMDKAKSVIVTLEPTAATALEVHSSPKPDPELEKARAVREMEEKLLASAFYSYGMNLHRNAVESRNSTLLQKARNKVNNSTTPTTGRRRSEF